MENQSAIIFALLLLANEFNFIVFMHSCNNDEIFLGKHEFVSLSNNQLEINFTLDDSLWTESHKAIIPCERCENRSKLHQIKIHFMTPLVIPCSNTCVSENLCVFSQNVISI